MSGTVQRAAEKALTERYEALLRVSQTLISIRSSQELFRLLAHELRAVMSFHFLRVGIYDENAPEPRLTLYGEPGVPLLVPSLPKEDTITWWVYQHQQPVIIPSLDAETRFPVVVEMLKNRGVRSVCALPLTAVHRRLGGLTVGSTETNAYNREEVSFLSLVANQVALAVDDSLNFDASQQAEEALRASEESLRLIIDSIPGLVDTMTAEGELEFVSQQCLDYFGMTLDELKGWTTSDIVHPDDLPRVLATWRRSFESGQPYMSEYRIRRADGIYRWFHVGALPWRNAQGRIIRWYALQTDIDDRKRAEEALRASEQSLRLIVDSIPGLVSTMNAAGEPQLFNRQLLEYFGRTPEELKSWASSDLVHPEDLRRVIADRTGSIETDQPYDIELRIRRADGVYRWFQVRNQPVRDSEGQIVRWYTLLTDIDERKQAEDRLQLLLDVTNQVVSNLQLQDLLRAISASVRHVMQCDCASLALPHGENKQLQLYVLDFPDGKGFLHEEGVYSIEGSPYGAAFRTVKPLAIESPFADWLDNSVIQNRISEGFKALCFIPLISRNRAIGTLNLGRLRGGAFTEEDLSFLGQVASQIAIAVENTSAYHEIAHARAELEKALEEIQRLKHRLQNENLVLREQIDQALMFEEIVGASPALRAVLSRVSKVAPTDSTVLLTGETGTGKELIARAIHKRSRRSSRAFVSVNCAAIPSSLIASELFGHEKGAFTGATQRRLGRFELAEEGTLFLDEVGELPAETQITLLRVLQEHEFERVGGNQPVGTNVRLIAATNRDLEAAIAAGTFRSDLFYRLNVFPIEIPPLRERQEDIPLLVEYFIAHFARKAGKSFRGINKRTLDLLRSYPWPGNIRELQNVVERSVIVCETENFSVDESWLSRQPHATEPKSQPTLSRKPAAQEKEIIEAALRESGGRVSGPSGAAAKLGIHRSTLESKIISLKIEKYSFKTASTSKNS
jgi:formate hydrogenlyase transcriptional activator